MEIIKNKSGSLRYREMLRIAGHIVKSPLFERKTDCKEWLSQQKVKRAKLKVYGEAYKIYEAAMFNDFCVQWLKGKAAEGLARTTIKKYEGFCKLHFKPFFKNKDLKEITRNEIESFQSHIRATHNAKGTNLIMTGLKALFKDAVRRDLIMRSPCDFVRRISADSVQYAFWTRVEINQFLRANHQNELYELILVAANTGMRKGELAGLCWDRVNFDENTITISRSRNNDEFKERTKTNLVRVIPMNEIVRATLLSIFKRRIESEFVFTKSNGEPINPHHLSRKFAIAQKKAGIANILRFHDLRHTFASQYVMGGGSIYDLQKMLGHMEITMTQRYAHRDQAYMQKAINGFSLGSLKIDKAEETNQILTIRSNLVANA